MATGRATASCSASHCSPPAAGCRLHAYVLMDNHVRLLLTPPKAGAVARLMQKLGRQYVGLFNARHGRAGTLWEGRYKACLVDSADYLLHCVRYIDLNPVRARMTDDPAAFAWSSCAALCGLREDALLTLHPTQRALARATPSRPRPTATCSPKHSTMKSLPRCASASSNSAPMVATTCAPWSKPRPVASPVCGRRTGPYEGS